MVIADSPLIAPENTDDPRRLGHHVRLTRQIRLVHHAVTVNHHTVNRGGFVWEDGDMVADLDIIERDILEGTIRFDMRNGWHSFGECFEHARCVLDRILFERFASREHENDDGPREVFVEKNSSDDRDPREQVGPELLAERFHHQLKDQRCPAEHQADIERNPSGLRSRVHPESEYEVRDDCHNRDDRDGDLSFVPE